MDSVPSIFSIPLLLTVAGNTHPAPGPRTPAAVTLTACAAATRADVEHALRLTVGEGKEQVGTGESSCDYAAAGGQVTVTIMRLSADLDMAAEIASLKAVIPNARLRSAAGIGTLAFFVDVGNAGTQLHVLSGGRDYLLVSILGFGSPARVSAAAEKIARKVLDRFQPHAAAARR